MSTIMKNLKGLALSETGFLFDPTTGHTYTLNRTGCEILKWMREGVEEPRLVGKIAEAFHVTADDAELDCVAFVKQLRDYRLLE